MIHQPEASARKPTSFHDLKSEEHVVRNKYAFTVEARVIRNSECRQRFQIRPGTELAQVAQTKTQNRLAVWHIERDLWDKRLIRVMAKQLDAQGKPGTEVLETYMRLSKEAGIEHARDWAAE